MKRFCWAILALVAIGCEKPSMPPNSPRVVKLTGPSDEKIVRISLDPSLTRTEGKDGQPNVWVPTRYQMSGEEKLYFDHLKFTPTSQGISIDHLPTIRLGKSASEFPIHQYGFAPFGLSNDLYFGHTFWDLDVWLMPSFIFLAPDAAKEAANYRLDRAKQAAQNYRDWVLTSGKNTDIGGMIFPWESSVSGKEVCLQKTKNQQHMSGDVVFGLTQAEAMGLADPNKVNKVVDGVGRFYENRSIVTKRGREILDVVSPNEKFRGDNDLYTNLIAEWVSNDRTWKTKNDYYLPMDKVSLLNYDGDPLTDYQQAAGLLAIYPLQSPIAEGQARKILDRFADKISPNGPAMGHAIVATIWARLKEPEKAYAAWMDSWKPYTNNPNHYFSERRNAFRPYFFTGAAGAINTVIYGFAGFRIDRTPLPNAKWTQHLKSGWWLSIKPNVPQEIGTIEMRGISIDGKKMDFSMNANGDFSAKPSAR